MRAVLMAAVLAVSACAGLQPFVPDTARLPAGALGGGLDPDVTAVNLAQWAFADSGRTYGRPLEAARAVASMDYIAGQLYTSPRWANISALTKEQLLEGRQEVRGAMFVAPGASSQQVVDSFSAAAAALAAGDPAAAARTLNSPVFTVSGDQVLARLANMPYLRMANVSTMKAANQLFENGGNNFRL